MPCVLFGAGLNHFDLTCPQLSPYVSQETTRQQTNVHEEKEAAADAGHAAAAEEVESGHRGDLQGSPSSLEAAESPPAPVSAAAGAHDEPPGEDDPASSLHSSHVGSERAQRFGEAVMYPRCCACGRRKFYLLRKAREYFMDFTFILIVVKSCCRYQTVAVEK